MRKLPLQETDLEPHQIREQLSRIQLNDEVKSSEVLLHFLQFVVEETLAGRVLEIKEYTIGIHALGRPNNFNPQLDAIVRIHAGRLRRLLYQYYSGPGKNDPIRIEMPKGAYVPVFTSNDFLPVTPFSSTAPYQEAKIPENARTEPIITDKRKKLTIAVLPFQNLSEDSQKDHFANGLGELLSTDLSRFQGISVVSYYSTRRCASLHSDIGKLSATLGAHYILTGSVRFSQDNIRMNVQLIFAETGEQIWAASYNRDLTPVNLNDITDQIIGQVASNVAGYYGIITHEMAKASQIQRSNVLGVYDAVYWYYYHHKEYNLAASEKAKTALELAVSADPEYALAWAILGELVLDDYLLGISGKEVIKTGFEYARTAIRLDRHCQHAYQTLAWAHLLSHDRIGCVSAMEECFALNPNATNVIGWKGLCFILIGDYERGKELTVRAIQHNLFYPWCYNLSMALYYFWNKEYAEALLWAQKINMPAVPTDRLIRIAILGQMNNREKAGELVEELNQLWPAIKQEVKPFLRRFILHEEMVDHLIEGLKAGGIRLK